MTPAPTDPRFDRHALATVIWLTAGLIAAALAHYGLGRGGAVAILAAFGVLVGAFIGHVIVNGFYRTGFSARELALGLVVYVVGLLAFGLAMLGRPAFGAKAFAPVSAGFLLLFVVVVFTMVTTSGVRGAFDKFDVIRTFRPKRGAE